MKKIIPIFLLFNILISSNMSFGEDMRIAGHNNKTPVKTVQKQIPHEQIINEYMRDMELRIKSNWKPENNSFKNKTVINFKIMRDGTIKNSKIKESSGDKCFDNDAIAAVTKTEKVAPLPKNLLGEYIDIIFTFERVSYLVKKDRYDF